MDTIDVSNLNRQFLFRKDHVGKSKSLIAKESVLKLSHNGRPGKILSIVFLLLDFIYRGVRVIRNFSEKSLKLFFVVQSSA